MKRCGWGEGDPLYRRYHDREWGVPLRNDRRLFEFLSLEGAQAGLSWITILRKRAHYREVFERFDPEKVARFSKKRIERLLKDPGIIRNRAKVESSVRNARAFLSAKEEFGTFRRYIWQFVDGEPIQNRFRTLKAIPAETPESREMARDLKQRGFSFVGPTICYAFMQATGMVNDHLITCFRHREVQKP